MNVFISQPMECLTNDKIKKRRLELFNMLKERYPTVKFHLIANPSYDDNLLIWYLGKSLEHIARADLVFFSKDWEIDYICSLEHAICRYYGIPILYEDGYFTMTQISHLWKEITNKMEHKIAIIPTYIVFLILIALIVITVACVPKSTKVETELSHAESYELYVLDNFSNGEIRLTLYNNYKVKSESIQNLDEYENISTTYNATDGTQIIFADNGVTVISPKGYKESFTEGYMWRK